MKQVYVHRDVPARLVECIRMISFNRIRPEAIPEHLRRLEELARTKLPYRQAGPPPDVAISVPEDTPQAGIDMVNRFYYGHLSRGEIMVAHSLITMWIRANLPTR